METEGQPVAPEISTEINAMEEEQSVGMEPQGNVMMDKGDEDMEDDQNNQENQNAEEDSKAGDKGPNTNAGGGGQKSKERNPEPNTVLGFFGLSNYTTDDILREECEKFGELEDIMVVKDRRTGRSRNFGFAYFEDLESAKNCREAMNGMSLNDRTIRVDYSLTRKPHEPTPGMYMGKPTSEQSSSAAPDRGGRYGRGGGRDRDRDRDYERRRGDRRDRERRDHRDRDRRRDRSRDRERDRDRDRDVGYRRRDRNRDHRRRRDYSRSRSPRSASYSPVRRDRRSPRSRSRSRSRSRERERYSRSDRSGSRRHHRGRNHSRRDRNNQRDVSPLRDSGGSGGADKRALSREGSTERFQD
eukprot:Clim_evm51s134 gene=Clim_evmTU51s134